MSESMRRADDADKQRAFLGLLANPVVTPWTDPALYTLVHRHAHTLSIWCKRLDYQLAHLDQCYRLRRTPLDGTVAIPHRLHPDKAELLLTLYAAIGLDDHREDSITIQELSDMVRLSAAGRNGWPYDPDQRKHRKVFLQALDRLVWHGVLESRTEQLHRETWERSGEGIGAGFLIHRDALVLFIDTGDVDLSFARRATSVEDTRGARLLRLLVETQAVHVDELGQGEREYLTNQRNRLADRAEEITGGSVEIRSDAIVLSIAPDRSLPSSLILDFPAATAQDWAALALIDRITAEHPSRTATDSEVWSHAARLHQEAKDRLTNELRESPRTIMTSVATRLTELGLLRIDADGVWRLMPLAGRYRDADLRIGDELQDPQTPLLMEDT